MPRSLEVRYQGKNLTDIMAMTVSEALAFFAGKAELQRRLSSLAAVGLDYVRLGQSLTTLSGGEAQRLKLAAHIGREKTHADRPGKTLFIFDEPTTGLHFADIQKLLTAFDSLVERGHSVLIVEHNLDVIKCADQVIDLGPEGGDGGGEVVAQGTPEAVARVRRSHTGRYLARALRETKRGDKGQRQRAKGKGPKAKGKGQRSQVHKLRAAIQRSVWSAPRSITSRMSLSTFPGTR